MSLPSPDPTPRKRLEAPTPALAATTEAHLTLPSAPGDCRDTRDTQRYHEIINSILHRDARPNDIRDSLMTTLKNEADRDIILPKLVEDGLPYSLKAEHRRPFADAVLTCVESEGQLAWDAVVSIVESSISLKDTQLYEHLGQEFCKYAVPPLSIFDSAQAFAKLLCLNVSRSPEIAAWVEFFKVQGTSESFQTMHQEVWKRIQRGEHSSYDHLVAVLCTTNNEHALAIMHTSLKKILRDTQPPSKPRPTTPKDLFAASCRALPLSAILVMVSSGPQNVMSLTTLALSGIFAITELLLKQVQPHQSSKPNITNSNLGAFKTFVENVHRNFSTLENPSPSACRIKELLTHNIECLRAIKKLPSEPM